MQQLVARGVSARSSIDAEHAADQFDAKDFDLISPRRFFRSRNA
jgi:hypothetical protein